MASLVQNSQMAEELLHVYGSPLYVYDGDKLRQTIARITSSVPYLNTQFRFATVTNGNISLLEIFRNAGWGIHANTPGDIYLGLKAGFPADKIVYSGSNLNCDEMSQVLKWGVTTLNLDSISQLQQLCEIYGGIGNQSNYPLKLGLRLNYPELTGDSRIGVRQQEFTVANALANQAGLKISGLHFYRGTGTNATTAFTTVIGTILDIAQTLPDWEYLDFGGGFGYPYRHGGAAFDWEIFGAELTSCLEKLGKKIELVIEPGRSAIAECGTLLAKVVSVKWQDEKQIVGVDTSIANLAVLSVHGGYREIIAYSQSSGLFPTDVCGNTTYSRDYLGKNCQLPALEVGDIIGILDVGAYGYAMSSHFLHRPKPAEVLLENGRHNLIRKREDYSIFLTSQI